MKLGKVTGHVISSQKDAGLAGAKLLIVQDVRLDDLEPVASYLVAVDSVGAGLGDLVITVAGSSARFAEGLREMPVDTAIVGIVDAVEVEGRTILGQAEAAGR